MLKYSALFICLLIILWLFARDRKSLPMTSGGLWIVLLWITIIGSRFVSAWFASGVEIDSSDVLIDGSPLDRNIFLTLIVTGAVVLIRRKPAWRIIFASNCWFFAFFFYCGMSILWSDFPFVSFKRWIKELGNIIMVMIILTERSPINAIIAVFARYTYVVIPLSVILIYFFPEIGTSIDADSMDIACTGVTINKNSLGVVTFICCLFTVWDLVYIRTQKEKTTDKVDLIRQVILLCVMSWLMYLANSMTALLCLVLGIGMLLIMKIPVFKSQSRFIGTYSLLLGLLIVYISSIPAIREAFLNTVGRDITLTGRTDLWADLWREPINPLVGTGYQSFWLGSRADFLWEKYLYHPIQAHNGYLETYLNGGMIGMFMLTAMIVKTGSNLNKYLLQDSNFTVLMQAIFVIAVLYNLTEAMFGRLTLFWVVLSVAALYHPPLHDSMSRHTFSRTSVGNTTNKELT